MAKTFDPAAFKAAIYSGGADNKLATRRGLDYAQDMGWSPAETATNWNDALGTDFGVADLFTAAKDQDVPNNRNQGGGSYLISALRGFSPAAPVDAGVKFYENPTIPVGKGLVRGAPAQTGNVNVPKMDYINRPVIAPPTPATDAAFTNPQAFSNEIYAGGANDTKATNRGLDIAQEFNWSPVETANNWNAALGTQFGAGDYFRVMNEADLIDPEVFNFGNYMYDGGRLNDADATVRGLRYAQEQNWTPEQTVKEWNTALGTDFDSADFLAALERHADQMSRVTSPGFTVDSSVG